MKFKILALIGILMICLLTAGWVNAAEDLGPSDNITANEISQEPFSQQDIEILSDDENYDVYLDEDEGVYIYESVYVDEGYYSIASLWDYNYFNGTIYASIDGENIFTKTYSTSDEEMFESVDIADLKNIPSYGIHKVNVTYQKNNVEKAFTIERDVEFTYYFEVSINFESNNQFEIEYCDSMAIQFNLPELTSGIVTFKLNKKTYNVNIKKGSGAIKIDTNNFKLGKYILTATFTDSSNKYPNRTIEIPITINPKIGWFSDTAIGDKDSILIVTPKDTKIKMTIYKNNDGKWGKKLATYSSEGGMFYIPIEDFATTSNVYYYINYTAGNISGFRELDIHLIANDKHFQSTFKKIGDTVKVIVNGPKLDDIDVEFYLDNGLEKIYWDFKKGTAKKVFTGLSVGKHKINVKIYGSKFYSKTFYITVKAKDKVSLSLKKANVKKYASKLILKATLKINKKAKKGLKVTFKFNGKTYKAKTNKKGIAKVKIKKRILRNLQIGKKVKYQVKYSFKTVSKTAKVIR